MCVAFIDAWKITAGSSLSECKGMIQGGTSDGRDLEYAKPPLFILPGEAARVKRVFFGLPGIMPKK